MRDGGFAYFVRLPRTLDDLMGPHLLNRERVFDVAAVVTLEAIDYENFSTDMLADRQFIEDHAESCCRGEIWSCILVQQAGRKDGILVIPEDGCYVGWAAYVVDGEVL